MTKAYEEVIDFIAAGTTPTRVASFEASPSVKERVADLILREKTTRLSPDDKSELEHCLE